MVRQQLGAPSKRYDVKYSAVLVYLPDKMGESDTYVSTIFPMGLKRYQNTLQFLDIINGCLDKMTLS